ncbi:MAG: LLM class flavin-dependent oxidoreductase [Pseudomonadota bacterium]|jgi:5,10-methylenetetrahydromethanopterin reductase|nr:LLM class flavin-dependent oxidoreductase [Pseudomonadota bacterium]
MKEAGPIRFGVNYLPNAALATLRWVQVAEEVGFDIVGIADSQSLYRDVYMCLGLCAANTQRVRLGPRVINPLTRHPAIAASAAATLEEMAPGRTMLGIGTGDSAVLNLDLRPSTRAQLTHYVDVVRQLLRCGEAEWQGRLCKLTWWRGEVPIYLAASGPKMLRLAGALADGVIINTGLTPDIIRDSIDQVRQGAEGAGRDLSDIDMWWLPLTNIRDSQSQAFDEIAMTLASAGSHLSRFTTEGKHIPPQLHDAIVQLGDRYRADQHDKPDSENRELIKELGLFDYLADRFAVAGSVDDCTEKIDKAIEAGARQFWMSIHFDDKEAFLRKWGAVIKVYR